MKEIEVGRPILIKGMSYAPTNEQGVVFLFGRLAAKLGFQIELGIVRSKFQGKTDITNDWPYIHDKIVKLNPKVKKLLNDYHFD